MAQLAAARLAVAGAVAVAGEALVVAQEAAASLARTAALPPPSSPQDKPGGQQQQQGKNQAQLQQKGAARLPRNRLAMHVWYVDMAILYVLVWQLSVWLLLFTCFT